MPRHSSGALWALLLLLGCPTPQRSFAVVSLAEAQSLLRTGGLSVVNAAPSEGAKAAETAQATPRRGPASEAHPGGVLVIASTDSEGYRAAAALSRSGNHPTYLCISANAEARSSLYALALQTREIARDEDP